MKPPIDRHKGHGVCMVVDCIKKAIYRQHSGTERGYCSAHKDLARPSPEQASYKIAYLGGRYGEYT